ncbi:hypothetical protein CHLNCDRAFT_136056 [Chlorella variabilis]|uniref:Uncharacterized protein n=1 Tax=Chlorella variabilis TaxID=554065 RepID=E1ZJN2_CHLVA|nr:hypothetical protein CHLNCDRAFT_136056 [Chlorella variabilis]EFN54018.1 hypothetical protein CHLNCDRAFT_136056 [Chlorella variabilis]|eukprot:XP_005846120.1 hypothetical protein CHLNCDRAFT_136056 [Chlorella variabilis]
MKASQTVGLALAAILLLSMNGAQARKMLADPPAEAPTYGYNAGLASQDGGVRRRLQEDSMAPGPAPYGWEEEDVGAAPAPMRKLLADAPAEAPTYGFDAGMASQDGGMRRRLQEDMAPGPAPYGWEEEVGAAPAPMRKLLAVTPAEAPTYGYDADMAMQE